MSWINIIRYLQKRTILTNRIVKKSDIFKPNIPLTGKINLKNNFDIIYSAH